jgi:hypothetical protein
MEIFNYKQWLIWNFRGDGRKVPMNRWGDASGVDRNSDFMTWDEANHLAETKAIQGPAFVFTESDPFYGIDLDNAVDPKTLEVKPWAQEIVDEVGSYTEISPSLSGLKIWARGELPQGCRHRYKVGDGELEIYESGRFFTFTGIYLECQPREVRDFDPSGLLERITPPEPPRSPVRLASVPIGSGLIERANSYCDSVTACKGSRNDTTFNLAGHLFSMADMGGEMMTEADVSSVMLQWNARQLEPLPESEVLRCVKNSANKGTPRGIKPAGQMIVDDFSDVDTSGITDPIPKEPYQIEPSKNDIRNPSLPLRPH